jgi:dienelactone hydrolase
MKELNMHPRITALHITTLRFTTLHFTTLYKFFFGVLALVFGVFAQAAIKTETIEYKVDGESFTGYLAYDDSSKDKRPGVLVVHEWWGHNDYVRKRAEMLAELGYTAFALDMYGTGKVADHPQDATRFMQAVVSNMPVAEKRFNAAYALLREHETVESTQVAAIGYCFGGGTVLHMARQGIDLKGVVSFHGSLAAQTPAKKDAVQAAVLVLTGADDPMIPVEQVAAFRQEMEAAAVNYKIHSYPGATHGFTNPAADDFGKRFEMPLAYNAAADAASWQRMREFFQTIFAASE